MTCQAVIIGICIPTFGILIFALGYYIYRRYWQGWMCKSNSSTDDTQITLVDKDDQTAPAVYPTPGPKPRPQSQLIKKPLTIARILTDDIKPDKEEYAALKDQDMRHHTLKFSQQTAKKCSSLNTHGTGCQ